MLFSQASEHLFFKRAFRAYLFETMRRGWPLIPQSSIQGKNLSVPAWPDFDKVINEASEIEASPDLDLLRSWKMSWEQQGEKALVYAQNAWTKNEFVILSPLQAGLTYLRCLRVMGQDEQLVQAWLSWNQKYLDPECLLEGLDAMERLKDPQRIPLLQQALNLYPADRRFFELMLLNQSHFPQANLLIKQDIRKNGGLSETTVRSLIRRLEKTQENRKMMIKFLWDSGLRSRDLQMAATLEDLTSFSPSLPQTLPYDDYLLWVRFWSKNSSLASEASGIFEWDTDVDGKTDTWITLNNGHLESWHEIAKDPSQGSFLALFKDSKLIQTIEKRKNESWSLIWEEYPYLEAIEWTKNNELVVFSFEPYKVAQPLFQAEKLLLPQPLWPLSLRLPYAHLNATSLDAILPLAVRKSTYQNDLLTQRLYLTQSQVWMAVEDSNLDKRPDTWLFYQDGKLASVYRHFLASPQADLLELYKKGQLASVLVDEDGNKKTDFAFFPDSQVELWDWNNRGSPLMRVIRAQTGQIKVFVFSSTQQPFLIMPKWQTFPWP